MRLWWRLASRIRSPIRSRSNSAIAARIVRTSLAIPSPETSPPRSRSHSEIRRALEIANHVQRVPCGSEHSVEFGRNDDVAGLERSDKSRSFRSIAKRDGARDPALDERLGEMVDAGR